jgi:hypothetical protein
LLFKFVFHGSQTHRTGIPWNSSSGIPRNSALQSENTGIPLPYRTPQTHRKKGPSNKYPQSMA